MPEYQYNENSQAIQSHLSLTQSVIQRMSSNSAACKAWCITLVSAVLVIVADKGIPQYAMLAFLPTALFLTLDTYYLALEGMFIKSYNTFIDKLHEGKIDAKDLYIIRPSGNSFYSFWSAIISFSIWPFYLTLIILIIIVKLIVI